jgi:fermentation-respiration switch protein FrsA (DUF1100 family)
MRRLQTLRRTRAVVIALTGLVALAGLVAGGRSGGGGTGGRGPTVEAPSKGSKARPTAVQVPAGGRFAVGEKTVTYVDRSRTIYLPGGGSEPRTLVTTILYPALPEASSPVSVAASGGVTLYPDAPPDRRAGPYPLVVFAPGFKQVPATYMVLLATWASHGFVVAGVTFPLTNPQAPGGPNEEDLANQPADLSFVIGQLVVQAGVTGSFLHGILAPGKVAVAGHSDGGDSAMAVAFDTCCRDPAVSAAVILSGAELHEPTGTYFPPKSPPLLAVQGTSDTVNRPSFTQSLYDDDTAGPKYLLMLEGAGPIDAYSQLNAWERVVAKVSLDFLNGYLYGWSESLAAIGRDGSVPSVATISSSMPSTPTTTSQVATTTSGGSSPAGGGAGGSSSGSPGSGGVATTSVPPTTTSTVPGQSPTTIFIPTEG